MPKKALMILGLMLLTGFIWGQVPIFNEAVPTFTDLPAGWTSNNGGGLAIMQTAKNGYLLVDHADDWVVSSAYDLSNYVSVELLFSVASYGSGDNNPLTIEVSNDNGATWTYQSFTSATPTSSTYIDSGVFGISTNSSQVKFRFRRDAATGKGVRFRNILLQGEPLGVVPMLTVSPGSLSGFTYEENSGPSEEQSFTVSGTDLDGNISITAPTNYEVSLSSGSGFAASLNVNHSGGTVAETTVYVRLIAGLSVGIYDNETISIGAGTAVSKSVTLSGNVTAEPLEGGYLVHFDGATETKASYASGTVNLSGLDWDMTEALIGSLAGDFYNGIKSARFSGKESSSMTMLEDKTGGLGVLSFQYRQYGSDSQVAWKVEYSSDGGTSWTQAGSDFTATADVQTFSETLNISGNIRIKISLVTDTGTSYTRMNIDDILLTDYSGSVQPLITVSPGSLSGFTYEEDSGPSAEQSFTVSGSNLDANVSITAPTNFEISQTSGSGFSGSLSLSPQSGTLDITTVYVRMVSGLDGDSYVGSIELSSTNAISRMISLSGEVSEAPVAGNYLVNFEGDGEIKIGYASGTVNLSGIDWNMTEALIGEMSTDLINGLRAARMRGYGTSAMSMLEDKSGGLGSLSFQYKQYGTDTRVSWRAEYSTNGGTTWMQAGADFTPSEFGDAQSFSALINVPGNVRVRIRTVEDTGTTDARLNIDDILLTEYDDTAQPMIAINPSSLSGFSYEEGFGPSTVQSFQVQGANLLGNIQISAPLHFELSQSAEGTFGNSLSLVHQDGSVSATTIYVRLISGLATGNYNGSIELTSPDASLQEISLSGSVSPVIIIDGYVVDFEGEGEVKAAYESGTVTLSGIDWNMTEALIGNTTADQINGSKSARLRGYGTSAMTMLGDKSDGLGSLSFFYRRYGSDSQVAWKAEYSIDGGITWIQAGEDFVAANNDETQSFSATINISSPGRIRIRTAESSGSSNARLNLDDISVTDYSGTTDPQIAVNPTNLSGFGYNEGFGPSASQSFALTAVFLSANLLLSASTDYEISLDNSFYQQQIDLTPQDGTVAQPIYVRLKDNLLSGTYNGSVQISSVGAEQKTVILTGNVSTLLLPDAPIALDATEVTSSSFKANWQAVNGASSYKLDVYTVSSEGGFDDLIISEYIEGSGTNKALEIYNGTGSTVSLTDYKVQILSNGNPTPSFSIDLGGNLANGDVYVLAHASAHADILAEADYLNAYAVSFNGNDAVAIYNTITEQYVDIFGVIGDDPGTAWTASGGYSTLDRTLVRKPEVRSGITQNPVGTGGDAFTTLSTEWNMYPTDTFSYIGTHSLSRRSISYVAGYQNLDVGNVSSYVVNGLAPDTDYYYVVRAANANGSSENSNTIEAFTQVISTPTVQARQIEAAITSNTITLEWTPGNGAKRIVVMNTQNFFNTPADGTDPVANPIYGGSGQQVVYNDATQIIEDAPFNGVLVEGLEASTTYHFRVFEYNGFGSNTMYLSSTATGNPSQFTTLSGGFTGYYEDIDGYGTALKAELHDLLRTTHATQYSYDALWTQLRYTDEDPNNSNNIIQIYTGWSIPKSNYGGGITQWNREHTWSKSHGDFGESRPAGTDLHHMRPCDATVNSAKGNKDFDEGGSLYVDASPYQGYSGNTGNYTTTYSWEPRDEEKGDVARMIMYMAVRYEGTDTSYDLEIVDYSNTAPNNEPYYGELSTLLTWHEQDPPDEWELQRNERIAERQGNRNPFVDHPEFAYMLWTPYPLGATTVTTSSFTANWNQPIIGSAYYLQVATDPEFTSFVSGYNNFNAGTSTSKVISGLSSGSTYYYRLRTAFQNGYSMYSPAQMVTTISPEPQATTASININNGNVILTITSVPGATAYLVFASDEPYGEFGDVSAQGSFDGNVWTSPVGEITQRFFKVYGVWE